MDFRNFFITYVFEVNKTIFCCFLKLTCPSDLEIQITSGFGGTLWYCRLGLMDFSNFFIPYVFDVKESVFCSFTQLFCSGDLENPGQLSGFAGTRGYWRLGLIDFRNFFILYVFEVKESIYRSFTKLPFSGDLKNPGQLPVLEVLSIESYGFS